MRFKLKLAKISRYVAGRKGEDFTISCSQSFPSHAFSIVLLLFATSFAYAQPTHDKLPFRPFHASYTVRIAGISVGKLTRDFTFNHDGTYAFASASEATGIASWLAKNSTEENVLGHFAAGEFLPQQYIRVRKKGQKIRAEEIIFDYLNGVATKKKNGIDTSISLVRPSFDPLSYQLQLMYDLATKQRLPSYTIHSTKKVKTHEVQVAPAETVQTPFGELLSIKITDHQADGKTTTFWCAKDLGYLTIKVLIEEGDESTLVLLDEFQAR